ncbi:hypothetical protein CVT26_015809 [Gymnopilus dilepis]|uniref:Uncharacterized protein n=1 Tax=Gymnopilus dilepis TaxID=231916 RepID=A0A409WMN0_9AGAR|nr:hypothetical protein CVT26_015809 [Gymnopilus dilepis]
MAMGSEFFINCLPRDMVIDFEVDLRLNGNYLVTSSRRWCGIVFIKAEEYFGNFEVGMNNLLIA